MPVSIPQGDLARAISHDPEEDWPVMIEIRAVWEKEPGKRTMSRSVTIGADEFFGRGGRGAPMSGDQVIAIINRLRRRRG